MAASYLGPPAMTTVDIEFCVPCGLLDPAVETQRELLETFGRALDGVQLVTGHGGVFKVFVDDELVFETAANGHEIDVAAIVETIDARLATGA